MEYMTLQKINLDYSNINEDDYPAYDNNTTYNINNKVTVVEDRKNYYCTADNTTGAIPKENPKKWVAQPMNKFACLSGAISTRTTNTDYINMTFNAINIDNIFLFDLVNAKEVFIRVTDNDTNSLIKEETISLITEDLMDFADYLYAEQDLKDRLRIPLPLFYSVKVEISIRNIGDTVSLGLIAIGRLQDAGATLWDGASIGLQSLSRKKRNEWGDVKLNKRNVIDLMNIKILIDNGKVDMVKNRFKKLDAVPLVIVGDSSGKFDSLTIYGFLNDLTIPLSVGKSIYNLEVESLI